MAGQFSIQRPAIGLPDFLGMKATGLSPQDLNPLLQATISVDDFYTARRITYLSVGGTPNLTVVGTISQGPTVPPGELWQLWNIGCKTATLGAGITFRLQMGVLLGNGGGNFIWIGDSFTYTPGEQVQLGYQFQRPMILSPADRVAVVVLNSLGAPNVNPTIYAVYTPIGV